MNWIDQVFCNKFVASERINVHVCKVLSVEHRARKPLGRRSFVYSCLRASRYVVCDDLAKAEPCQKPRCVSHSRSKVSTSCQAPALYMYMYVYRMHAKLHVRVRLWADFVQHRRLDVVWLRARPAQLSSDWSPLSHCPPKQKESTQRYSRSGPVKVCRIIPWVVRLKQEWNLLIGLR